MNKKTVLLIAFLFLPVIANAETYWGGELPDVSDTTANAEVTLEGDTYTYSYSVHSSSANSGNIWRFRIDIKQARRGMELSNVGLVSGLGYMRHTSNNILSEPSTPEMVPVGMFSPIDWHSGLDIHGTTGWGADDDENMILSGQSLSGFKITSHGLPGIREIRIEPDLIHPRVGTVTIDQINEVRGKASFFAKTIGPTAPPSDVENAFSPKALLEMIGGYIDESATLGWLTDAALANSLRAKLALVRTAMEADNPNQAKVVLGEVMALLANSTASQRTNEGYGLLYYNAKYLKDHLK